MAWSASKWGVQPLIQILGRTTEAIDLNGSALWAALYDDTITPLSTAAAASFRYNTGVWASTNEVTSAGEWDAGGKNLSGASVAVHPTVNTTVRWDATDPASSTGATIVDAYGVFHYDATHANKPGICYNWLGGPASVTNGQLTVVYSTAGIASIAAA